MTISQSLENVAISQEVERGVQWGKNIVIIVPTFNEENGIEKLIRKTKRIISNYTKNYDIIVVDDGSFDHTRNILENLDVARFYHRKNLGKGDVIRNILSFLSPEEIVITMDGDGEHDPNDISRLITPILNGTADIVIGSRFKDRKKGELTYLNRRKEKAHIRNFGNKLFSFLLWIFTRKNITDTQSGFRAFVAGKMKKLNLTSDGFRIEMEMTVKALQKGYRIVEVPISNGIPRRKSHLNLVVDGFRIALTVLREFLPRGLNIIISWILPRVPQRLSKLIG
ncbi:MAG: glycosyltransferase family 2 protein [Promethearchaeota archaeon]